MSNLRLFNRLMSGLIREMQELLIRNFSKYVFPLLRILLIIINLLFNKKSVILFI